MIRNDSDLKYFLFFSRYLKLGHLKFGVKIVYRACGNPGVGLKILPVVMTAFAINRRKL